MTNIETKITEGFDIEGRVILSCEVWTNDEHEHYGEVAYYSYSDEFVVVKGVEVTEEMQAAAIAAIKGYGA